MKKINKQLLFVLCMIGFTANVSAQDLGSYDSIDLRDSVIVCRSRDCRPAKSMMTKEFLYNKLTSLLKNNINRRVELCEAHPLTHVCLEDGISFDAVVGATKTHITLPSLFVLDAKSHTDITTTDFIVDYDFQVGETFPECQAALNQLAVECTNNIFIETPGFTCHFTSNGSTEVNAAYSIDYIDIDYGIIGADYTIGLDQTSQGGKSGYVVMRFANAANDTNELTKRCNCESSCDERRPLTCPTSEEKTENTAKDTVTPEVEQEPEVEIIIEDPEPEMVSVEVTQTSQEIQKFDPQYPIITEVEEI